MATIRKRGNKYSAEVNFRGVKKHNTFASLRQANYWAAKVELEIEEGVHQGITHVFADVIEKYAQHITPTKRGADNELIQLRRLRREKWVHIELDKLTIEHLAAYRDVRLKTIKPSTFKREYTLVKAMAAKASLFNIEVNQLLFNGLPIPKAFPKDIKRITKDHEQRLLDAANDGIGQFEYLHPLIRLALATAMRRGELLSLHWSDVDMDSGWLEVAAHKAKSGYSRKIPLTDAALEALRDLKDLAGNSESVVGCTSSAVKCSFERLRTRAGLKHIRFHDLRHEGISRLHEMGLTLPEIQSISGHREMAMLERYSHASVSSLAAKLRGASHD